jgi:hypothetical protein
VTARIDIAKMVGEQWWLLMRRNASTDELPVCRCWSPQGPYNPSVRGGRRA